MPIEKALGSIVRASICTLTSRGLLRMAPKKTRPAARLSPWAHFVNNVVTANLTFFPDKDKLLVVQQALTEIDYRQYLNVASKPQLKSLLQVLISSQGRSSSESMWHLRNSILVVPKLDVLMLILECGQDIWHGGNARNGKPPLSLILKLLYLVADKIVGTKHESMLVIGSGAAKPSFPRPSRFNTLSSLSMRGRWPKMPGDNAPPPIYVFGDRKYGVRKSL